MSLRGKMEALMILPLYFSSHKEITSLILTQSRRKPGIFSLKGQGDLDQSSILSNFGSVGD